MTTDLITIKQVTKTYGSKSKEITALKDISLSIPKGTTLGIIGESGSGKTTLGKVVAGIESPTSGEIDYNGQVVHKLKSAHRRDFLQKVQFIFQDSTAALNPRWKVRDSVTEGYISFGLGDKGLKDKVAGDALERVGLDRRYIDRYPHEFSGGQRQRIAIARALLCEPEVLILDEPISALDVSLQIQIVHLLQKIQKEQGYTYLFIAHDLPMVHYLCEKVAVLYKGELVEFGNTDEVFCNPQHSYTKTLLASTPKISG
ncbi:ATP-binding cassette domain-containing protein [Bacillus thuringiensis]|uniref:ABC transporter ATP-binding protein n=1 Tax=Bacillus thuringiensis TaxID=1428 RepID=UPI002DBD1242|nr:ATP-binding cassette domain-containing protein [Bacillus thuringiensis]MEC3539314.1 ATP-binding cassette domain-containing protein [Bacillus thuringiensis]